MLAILDIIVKAILGGFVDAFTAWRRDQALEQLGYTKAQRDDAVAGLGVAARVVEAQKRAESVQRLDRDAAADRLRDGTF